jgi:hypothetical protein
MAALLHGRDCECTDKSMPFGSIVSASLVLGAAIVNRTTYPGTGEFRVSFPVWARAMAQAIGDEILQDLRDDACRWRNQR